MYLKLPRWASVRSLYRYISIQPEIGLEKCRRRRRRVLKNKNTLYDSPLSIILFTVQLIDSIFICYLVWLLESERLLGGRAYMHAIAIGEHRSMSVERIIRDLETVGIYLQTTVQLSIDLSGWQVRSYTKRNPSVCWWVPILAVQTNDHPPLTIQ